MVNEWNNPSDEVISSKSLAGSKKLDFHLRYNMGYI